MGEMTELSGAICGYLGVQYHVRARRHGMRRYERIGKPTRSFRAAVRRMSDAFVENFDYKRAEVLMTADYYDPQQLCEITR